MTFTDDGDWTVTEAVWQLAHGQDDGLTDNARGRILGLAESNPQYRLLLALTRAIAELRSGTALLCPDCAMEVARERGDNWYRSECEDSCDGPLDHAGLCPGGDETCSRCGEHRFVARVEEL